jgi:hypothetical protein
VVRPRQNICTVCIEEGSFNCSTEGGEGKTMIHTLADILYVHVCTRMYLYVYIYMYLYVYVYVYFYVYVLVYLLLVDCGSITGSSFYTNLGFFLENTIQ